MILIFASMLLITEQNGYLSGFSRFIIINEKKEVLHEIAKNGY